MRIIAIYVVYTYFEITDIVEIYFIDVHPSKDTQKLYRIKNVKYGIKKLRVRDTLQSNENWAIAEPRV